MRWEARAMMSLPAVILLPWPSLAKRVLSTRTIGKGQVRDSGHLETLPRPMGRPVLTLTPSAISTFERIDSSYSCKP